MRAPHDAAAQERKHSRLILPALAGPIVWSVHFLFVYLLVELACRANLLSSVTLGVTALGWVNLAATVLAVGILAWIGARAYGGWRSERTRERGKDIAGLGRVVGSPEEFLRVSAWSMSLLFGVLVALTAAPLLVLPPCPWA